jgi:hypothetical protein
MEAIFGLQADKKRYDAVMGGPKDRAKSGRPPQCPKRMNKE